MHGDRAVKHVEGGEQRGCAVALVVVGDTFDVAEPHGKHGLGALSHGLAIPASADPVLSDDTSALARIIVLASGKDDVTESARIAAEAQVDIFRIRKVRSSIYDRLSRSPRQEADHAKLSKCLASLERYERRAFSRRKRALRDISQTGYDQHYK